MSKLTASRGFKNKDAKKEKHNRDNRGHQRSMKRGDHPRRDNNGQ